MNKIRSKNKRYIAPFGIFLTSVAISLCVINNEPTRITLSLSILGLGFAIFQFWVSEMNSENRKQYDIKLSIYKEYTKSINQFSTLFNFKINIYNIEDAEDKAFFITKAYADLISTLDQCKIIFKISDKNKNLSNLLNSASKLHSQFTRYRMDIMELRTETYKLKKSEMTENITLWKDKSDTINKELKNVKEGIPFDYNLFLLKKELWDFDAQSTDLRVKFADLEFNINTFSTLYECMNSAIPTLQKLNKFDNKFKDEMISRL